MTDQDPSCLFCRIASGEAAADRVFEDDRVIAFRDIQPRAPTHLLVIPRRHIGSAHELGDDAAALLAALFGAMRRLADEAGLGDGYRIVTNVGPLAGQSVSHLHFHLLGGRPMTWPPG